VIQVKWHIITSNKGGVGKTLLSLMLLLSFLKDERGKVALVVDLNGMNPDLRWLLGTKIHEIKVKDLGVEGKPFPLNYQSINFTKNG
jgi:CO dehydrogenase nickel-insertion accessory protein CooC1